MSKILHALPAFVFIWMVIGAGLVFTPNPTGRRRDMRSGWIALSFWAMAAATSRGVAPPPWMAAIGVAGLAMAFALFNWAAASIRGRMFSYVLSDDTPQFLHTSGPYRYVRNPFYASYLLALIGTELLWPTIWGAIIAIAMVGYFEWVARFEERKFANSPVAAEYARYKARTGRLLPRFHTD